MKTSNRARGLSLVEVLVTLSICSALMAAVTMAFSATSQAIAQNEAYFKSMQGARVAVTQLMAEARKCRSGTVDDTSFELVTALGETREYHYDAAAKQLKLTPHVGPAPWKSYVLARNVESARFASTGGSISLTLTISCGNNRASLGGAAVLRKTVQYN